MSDSQFSNLLLLCLLFLYLYNSFFFLFINAALHCISYTASWHVYLLVIDGALMLRARECMIELILLCVDDYSILRTMLLAFWMVTMLWLLALTSMHSVMNYGFEHIDTYVDCAQCCSRSLLCHSHSSVCACPSRNEPARMLKFCPSDHPVTSQ